MCGIVGVISKNKSGMLESHCDIFTQLLYADQLRGSDGTGIFYNSILGGSDVKRLKAPVPSSEFITSKEYDNALDVVFKKSNFVVGHNRAATKGKLNAACTHPFTEDHITLVHNGTLVSHKELHSTYEVDSRAICHSIAKDGYEKTLKKIDGAFSLIWYDTKEETLNICRNYQRPLHIIETFDCYIISSELELGQWIAKRHNKHIISSFPVAVETLYKFNIKDMSKFETEKVEYLKCVAPAAVYQGNWKNSSSVSSVWDDKMGKAHYLGEILKFKAGKIISGTTTYLEGDICVETKNLAKHLRTNLSYEDLHRIRVYDNMDKLLDLQKKKHLTGKIEQSFWAFSRSNYQMVDVAEEPEKDTPTSIVTYKKNINETCEICNAHIGKHKKFYEGMHMCEDCYDFYTVSGVMYGC